MKSESKGNDQKPTWKDLFMGLPPEVRVCRHEFTGYVKERTCMDYFDCGRCVIHGYVERLDELRLNNGWRPKSPETDIFGLSMPLDRMYHRGHLWCNEEADGVYSIGLDDFATRVIGTPDDVEIPVMGSEVEVNDTVITIGKKEARIHLRSPVTGQVIEAGSPATDWYLKIRVKENGSATKHLLKGSEIRPWILKEIERLQGALSNEGLGVVIADGGVLVEDLPASYPDANWANVFRKIFY